MSGIRNHRDSFGRKEREEILSRESKGKSIHVFQRKHSHIPAKGEKLNMKRTAAILRDIVAGYVCTIVALTVDWWEPRANRYADVTNAYEED